MSIETPRDQRGAPGASTPPATRGSSRSPSPSPSSFPFPARPEAPLAVLALFLLVGGCGPGRVQGGGGESAPVPVRVAKVTTRDVPVEIRAVGNVEPYSTVALKSRVAGQVAQVNFKEGDRVHSGDLLFSIDSRTYEANLNQAKANLARDVADADLADAQASRLERLYKEGVSSRDDFDVATARASSLRAAIDADRAAIESAKLFLGYCSIRSSIDGVIGEILVHAGNIVKENDTTLAVIRQHIPIYVRFAVPERHLAAVREERQRGALRVTATPTDGGADAAVGELSFIDNAVDELTGTIALKAIFPNRDERLWPGQFVDASLTLSVRPGAVVAPDRAIVLGQDGHFAFVVRADNTVESRPVTSERVDGGMDVIHKGLSAGETVVIDGQLRLVSGSRVTIIENESPKEAPSGTTARAPLAPERPPNGAGGEPENRGAPAESPAVAPTGGGSQ